MWVIDSILTSCYYDVSIIPYWTYEVLTVIRVAVRRGNQVRILSDPVTVTEERLFDIPLYDSMRRGKEVMILKSGNLLCMARLNFRVKCNNQLRVSATQSVVCLLEAGIFLWNSPVRMNYTYMYRGGRHIHTSPLKGMIKWQAVLLRMHSFPPHIWTDSLSTPEQYRKSSKISFEDDQFGSAVTGFFYITRWK